jgi:hypothetical protein
LAELDEAMGDENDEGVLDGPGEDDHDDDDDDDDDDEEGEEGEEEGEGEEADNETGRKFVEERSHDTLVSVSGCIEIELSMNGENAIQVDDVTAMQPSKSNQFIVNGTRSA